jgi:predicted nucleotidyltransferase
MDRATIIARIRKNDEVLGDMGVLSLALFGSAGRDELGPDSDVDVLVEFSRPVGLFAFVRVKRSLEAILGREVDLVTPDALRESMKPAILEEAVRVTP